MSVRERIGNFACDLYRVVDWKPAVTAESRTQRLAIGVRHHVPQKTARATGVEQWKDMRMLQQGRDANLLEEALRSDRGCDFVAHHFDRDGTIVANVPREIDRGHAAAGNLSF